MILVVDTLPIFAFKGTCMKSLVCTFIIVVTKY